MPNNNTVNSLKDLCVEVEQLTQRLEAALERQWASNKLLRVSNKLLRYRVKRLRRDVKRLRHRVESLYRFKDREVDPKVLHLLLVNRLHEAEALNHLLLVQSEFDEHIENEHIDLIDRWMVDLRLSWRYLNELVLPKFWLPYDGFIMLPDTELLRRIERAVMPVGILMTAYPIFFAASSLIQGTIILSPVLLIVFLVGVIALKLAVRWESDS